MDDKIAIETLAKFMEIWKPDDTEATGYERLTWEGRQKSDNKDPACCGSVSLAIHVRQMRDPNDWPLKLKAHELWAAEMLPAYLTDYNAIANVWSKVYEELGYDGESNGMNELFGGYPHSVETLRAWWLKPPRDHAHALAKAIQETKEG